MSKVLKTCQRDFCLDYKQQTEDSLVDLHSSDFDLSSIVVSYSSEEEHLMNHRKTFYLDQTPSILFQGASMKEVN